MILHHIGIVVRHMETSIGIYEQLGYKVLSAPVFDDVQNNMIVFMENETSHEIIELIMPSNDSSTVYNSKNTGIHHLCYRVSDMEEFIASFKKKSIGTIFTKKLNAPAIGNKNIMFAYLKNGQIIEVLEDDAR